MQIFINPTGICALLNIFQIDKDKIQRLVYYVRSFETHK